MDDLLMRMVMEAEASRRRNQQNRQQQTTDNEFTDDDDPIDYGANVPSPDEDTGEEDVGTENNSTNNVNDQDTDYGANAPPPDDETEDPNTSPVDNVNTDDSEPDYGANTPSPDEDTGEEDVGTGNNPVDNVGDQAQGNAPPPDDGEVQGTDYGANTPSPDEDSGEEDAETGGDNVGQSQDPNAPTEDNQDQGASPEENVEGQDGQDPNDSSADGTNQGEEDDIPPEDPATGELNDHDKLILGFTLEKDFVRLYKDIRTHIKKIQEAHRETMLASVTTDIVIENLEKIRDMVYNYIIYEFDQATYEEALYNFNYIIEIVRQNFAMLKKVKDAEDKVRKEKR